MAHRTNRFTLVEIIAVLLLIAVLAATAAPKFVGIADEAKKGVAQAGINEAKSSLTLGYHKAYIAAQGQPTVGDVANLVFGSGAGADTTAVFGDITVKITSMPAATAATGSIGLSACLTAEDDSNASLVATDSWTMPSN